MFFLVRNFYKRVILTILLQTKTFCIMSKKNKGDPKIVDSTNTNYDDGVSFEAVLIGLGLLALGVIAAVLSDLK